MLGFQLMKKQQSQAIEAIRKKLKNEWLLIAIDEIDAKTGIPSKGHLIAHGPQRNDIHEASKKYNGDAYIIYSEDWPDDLAASFALALR